MHRIYEGTLQCFDYEGNIVPHDALLLHENMPSEEKEQNEGKKEKKGRSLRKLCGMSSLWGILLESFLFVACSFWKLHRKTSPIHEIGTLYEHISKKNSFFNSPGSAGLRVGQVSIHGKYITKAECRTNSPEKECL